MNLLITNANSYKAVVIATFIKQNYKDIQVVGLIRNPKGKIFHSKYFDKVILPKSIITDKNFETEIVEIITENKIGTLIPIDSKEIATWLKLKPKLKSTLDYYSDYEIFNLLNDKLLFAETCNKLKISCPKTYFPDQIQTIKKELKYVFKPTKSSSSKGVKYFNELNELKAYCRNYPDQDFIVQEYYSGIGGGISLFAKNGEVKDYYLHQRVLEYPVSGGSSTMRATFNSDLEGDIVKDAQKLARHLNWSGFCMLELKFNKDDYTFIEANPRIWGSIGQGLANGTNYFRTMLGNIDLEKSNKITYQTPLVFLSLFGYLLKGNLKMFFNFWKLFKAEPDINIFKDPKGYIGQFFI